jgi:AraC-like DNA-binding protein
VLNKRRLYSSLDLAVDDVRCVAGTSRWSPPEDTAAFAIVFVRRGCFQRQVDGHDVLVDPSVVYFERPAEEQRIRHPVEGGDACTVLTISSEALWSIRADEDPLPAGSVRSSAPADLTHRRLLADCLRGEDEAAEEHAIHLASVVLASAEDRESSTRPMRDVARRRLVDDARAVLSDDLTLGLVEVARRIATSPSHLSRVFGWCTGETFSRYRTRLRVSLALERLQGGERNLADVAASTGFADHAHLTRTLRRELGNTPSELRTLLSMSA